MPDHYHIIIKPEPKRTLGKTMQMLNGNLARDWNQVQNSSGQVIQHGFYDHAIRNTTDYQVKARYIHNNPVRAGLVSLPENYPWSSARARLTGVGEPTPLDQIQ